MAVTQGRSTRSDFIVSTYFRNDSVDYRPSSSYYPIFDLKGSQNGGSILFKKKHKNHSHMSCHKERYAYGNVVYLFTKHTAGGSICCTKSVSKLTHEYAALGKQMQI